MFEGVLGDSDAHFKIASSESNNGDIGAAD
jgi:hypothetical protein